MPKVKCEKQHFFEDEIIKTEDRFIEAYMNENPNKIRSLKLLFKLYKGHYLRLLLGAIVYITNINKAPLKNIC